LYFAALREESVHGSISILRDGMDRYCVTQEKQDERKSQVILEETLGEKRKKRKSEFGLMNSHGRLRMRPRKAASLALTTFTSLFHIPRSLSLLLLDS
jgi:hypothetical protein